MNGSLGSSYRKSLTYGILKSWSLVWSLVYLALNDYEYPNSRNKVNGPMDEWKTFFLAQLSWRGWFAWRFLRIPYFSSVLGLTDAFNLQTENLRHVHDMGWEMGEEGVPERGTFSFLPFHRCLPPPPPTPPRLSSHFCASVLLCFLTKRNWGFTVLGTILSGLYSLPHLTWPFPYSFYFGRSWYRKGPVLEKLWN